MSTRLNIETAVEGVRLADSGVPGSQVKLAGGIGFEVGRVPEIEGSARLSAALAAGSVSEGLVFSVGDRRATAGLRHRSVAAWFSPSRLVTVETANRRETLWAAEEALRCSGTSVVAVHLGLGPDLFESRRLQVAAQAGGGLGLVMIARWAQSSAAQSRWRCEPCPDSGAWEWSLTKNRRGRLLSWEVLCERPPDQSLPPDLRLPPRTPPQS